jgi:hypothetical protein
MNAEHQRESLRSATARAMARVGEDDRFPRGGADEPLRPGDLVALPATAEYPLEWLVVATGGRGGRALVVPADVHPAVGSGDVAIPPRERGGPLRLRCRFAVRVEGALLASGRVTGVVDADVVARVRRRVREQRADRPGAAPLRPGADEEEAVRDWIAEAVAPAREALLRHADAAAGGRPFVAAGARVAAALAALFFVASVGLSVWVSELRREIGRLSQPALGVPAVEVVFGETTRGSSRLELERSGDYLVLDVLLGDELPAYEHYRLQIAAAGGAPLWTSAPFASEPFAEVPVVVPAALLPPTGALRLRLYGVAADGPRLLEERRVSLVPRTR